MCNSLKKNLKLIELFFKGAYLVHIFSNILIPKGEEESKITPVVCRTHTSFKSSIITEVGMYHKDDLNMSL